MLVEIADQAGSEKPIAVKTKSQEGWLRVTICLRKGWEKDGVSPCLTLRGATRMSLVKLGVTGGSAARIIRVIADVETHVAERGLPELGEEKDENRTG